MADEMWLFTLVHIAIGWCAKMGVTVIRVRATTMVISLYVDEFTLLYNGMKAIGFINAKVISGP